MPPAPGEQSVAFPSQLPEEGRCAGTTGSAGTVVMLVTSNGLSDPRVVRSMRAARRAGLGVRLVCRAFLRERPERAAPEGVAVHRIGPLLSNFAWAQRLKRAYTNPRRPANGPRNGRPTAIEPFWMRPWELWILGGIGWFNLQAVWAVRRFPAVLYHAHDLDTLPAAVILSRLRKAPVLFDAHELFSSQFIGASRQFRAILFAMEHWLIRRARKVVTVNPSIAETLAAWHAVPLPAVVMNCPLRLASGKRADVDDGTRRRQAARVIYQGIYTRDRGLEEMIRSARWFESAELSLRGYGDLEPRLRALVKAEGLEARVHFLPPAEPDRLVESLEGFDIGVVPYRPTTLNNRLCLPNKVFEYLQAGLALALSDLPELQRLIKETAAGELFDPEQPEDIARAINALTRDAVRLAECRTRAQAAGRDRYTWEAQGEPQLLACYRELAGLSQPTEGADVHVRDSRNL